MTIRQLNKTEAKKVKRFQNAWKKLVKNAIVKGNLSKSSLTRMNKDTKIIAKSIVNSGLSLGILWLESHAPKK